MATAALLDSSFVRELELLRRSLDMAARSGGVGEHIARRRGGSAEFHEHRSYAPGDDLRRIDWAAYARSGEPVVKVFRAEEDVIVRLLCDTSASLGFGEPSKLDVAKRLAAALGYMTLASAERAQVFVPDGVRARAYPPSRGRRGVPELLARLDALSAHGAIDLARAVDSVVAESARPGLLAVFSDFFDAGRWPEALSRAAAAGHEVALVQVVSDEDVAPSFDGDLALEDAETGEVVELVMDAAAIAAYERRFSALCLEIRAWARRHGGTYVRARSSEPLDAVMRRIVSRAVDA